MCAQQVQDCAQGNALVSVFLEAVEEEFFLVPRENLLQDRYP
jgi:hypothetical protein